MKGYRRACQIIAEEGPSGLLRRLKRRIQKADPFGSRATQVADQEWKRRRQVFYQKSRELEYADLENFYWYHTVDLGNSIVTPGDYDYRSTVAAYHFPTDMKGMTALDVGSATGFFAFELEKRGAEVTSVDLPSLAQWDVPPQKRSEILDELMEAHGRAKNIEELTYRHMHGPFEFCRTLLKSHVRRIESTIYDLSATKLGKDGFDLVFLGDILVHLFSPLTAMAAVSPLCRGTLIISNDVFNDPADVPLMKFHGGASDRRSWWSMNYTFLERMLNVMGFNSVTIVDYSRGFHQRLGWSFERPVVHARR